MPSELCYLDSGKHHEQEQSIDSPGHLCGTIVPWMRCLQSEPHLKQACQYPGTVLLSAS